MPEYTELPQDWCTALEAFTGYRYHLDLLLDPEADAVVIGGGSGIRRVTHISNVRELDPRWAGRSALSDVQVDIHDPDGSLSPLHSGSPLHAAVAVLNRDTETTDTELELVHVNGTTFAPGQQVTITGEKYYYGQVCNVKAVVQSFTPGTVTDLLTLTAPVGIHYIAGAQVCTHPVENRQVQLRLHLDGTAQPQVIYRGRIQQVQTFAGYIRLVLADAKKHSLDRSLTGVDLNPGPCLQYIYAQGDAVSSIQWNDGSDGALDRTQVYPARDCRPGTWRMDFITSREYNLTGPGIKGIQGDIRYGMKKHITGPDLGFAWHLCKYQGYLYIPVVESGKLAIFNVYDPGDPQQVSAFTFAQNAIYASAAVYSNYVFVPYVEFDGQFTGKLKSIYTGNIANPTLIDTLTAGAEGVPSDFDCYACHLYGNYLFVQGHADIFVFNVSDPWNMNYVTRIGGQGAPNYMHGLWDFAIDGHYLYTVSEFDRRFVVIDIDTPRTPVLIATLELETGGSCVAVSGSHAFVKCGNGVLYVIDISNPQQPALVHASGNAGIPWYTSSYGLQADGSRLYSVSCHSHALTVMDVSAAPAITRVETIRGADAPFHLLAPLDLVVEGEYAWVAVEDGLTVYRLHPALPSVQVSEQLRIVPAAWGGTVRAGDSVSFRTGRTWAHENPVSILHDLLVNHAGIPGHLIDASGFFGEKIVGQLMSELPAGGTSVSIRTTAPVLIKSGQTLVIAGHELPVTTGTVPGCQYPPEITVSVTNTVMEVIPAGEPVCLAASTEPDPDYNFDREYIHCRDQDLSISLALERDMSILQAIECVTAHCNGFSYTDRWGVERLFIYRRTDIPAIAVRGDLNLLPNPELTTRELVNGIDTHYGYSYADNVYATETSYPGPDVLHYSAMRHGLERRVTLSLPGFYSDAGPLLLASYMHGLWHNGLTVITCRTDFKGLAIDVGDVLHVSSEYPLFDRYMRVTGVTLTFDDGPEIMLQGYDMTGEREEGT